MYGTSDLPATMRPGPVHVCGRPDCGMHAVPAETPAST